MVAYHIERGAYMRVPLLDLKEQYDRIQAEVEEVVSGVLKSGHYILGENVKSLEKEVAHYAGASHAIGVASGTDALRLSLAALGIQPGDEVITTPFTFIATTQVISQIGAIPVLVDIEPATLNIDAGKIEEAITPKTKAILPVHIFGHPANMSVVMDIARRHHLVVVEDAAQSFGAECRISLPGDSAPRWHKAGSIGNAGCFSFFPTKNLGGFGDGGMILTSDDALAEKVRSLRIHGGNSHTYSYDAFGYNSRLDELQAAILRIKLKYVDTWIKLRRKRAKEYEEILSHVPQISFLTVRTYARHSYCVLTILTRERDALRRHLEVQGIDTKIYYPIPIHMQVIYRNGNLRKMNLPIAENACHEVLSLPIYPELEPEKIHYIAEAITSFFTD